MKPVFAMQPQAFLGWWCPQCHHWEKPVGREHQLELGQALEVQCPLCGHPLCSDREPRLDHQYDHSTWPYSV